MRSLACLTVMMCAAFPLRAASVVEKGDFRFKPAGDQKNVPARYRLEARDFTYEMEKKNDLPAVGVSVYRVRFPSPVKTATLENNTVHAEYYRPAGQGPFPGVIVLDITGGNQ